MSKEKRPSPEAAPQYREPSKLEVGIRTLTGNYRPHGSLQEADSILCLSMGYRIEQNVYGEDIVTPGSINDSLAGCIHDLDLDLPLFSQFEVDDALGGIAQARSGSPDIWLRGDYHDTEDVVSELTSKMEKAGAHRPIVVAQAYHATYVDMVVREHGLETVLLEGLPRDWDPENAQTWVRNKTNWRKHTFKKALGE